MRLKTVLLIVLGVNAVWAAALFGFRKRPELPVMKPAPIASPVSQNPARPASSNEAVPASSFAKVASNATALLTNDVAKSIASPTNALTNTAVAVQKTNAAEIIPAGRKFTWKDVQSDEYLKYVAQLRAVGCPEPQIQHIILHDIQELFNQKRLSAAIAADPPWWKSDAFFGTLQMQPVATSNLEEERSTLLSKLLGPDGERTARLPPLASGGVHLTGPVLGALALDKFNAVQDICARSMDRHQSYFMSRANEGQPMDPAELARLRNQTRTDLATVLNPEEIEEFLLRYSHNATKLRQDLRGLDTTPEEFRKMFRAMDPIEHQMQMDYGTMEALSPKQREQLESQLDRAIKEVLPRERYQTYTLTKDPLYRQAQTVALQYGLNPKAVLPIYQLNQTLETKRQKIASDASLTPEQKNAAMQAVQFEQQQAMQRIQSNVGYR